MKTGQFETWLQLPDESEVDVIVKWEGTYERAYISGPPENCYPETSEMEILSVEFVGDWPEGLTQKEFDALCKKAEDRFLCRAWDQLKNSEDDYDA